MSFYLWINNFFFFLSLEGETVNLLIFYFIFESVKVLSNKQEKKRKKEKKKPESQIEAVVSALKMKESSKNITGDPLIWIEIEANLHVSVESISR